MCWRRDKLMLKTDNKLWSFKEKQMAKKTNNSTTIKKINNFLSFIFDLKLFQDSLKKTELSQCIIFNGHTKECSF